ncbi:MAG TPA: hypothetical protein PKD41_04175 [Solidesulfovibrio sp.]|nr:hypothetical protein [Solidesulfovibrio sp.]
MAGYGGRQHGIPGRLRNHDLSGSVIYDRFAPYCMAFSFFKRHVMGLSHANPAYDMNNTKGVTALRATINDNMLE